MKFYSKPVVENADVPVADDGQLENLINSWEQRKIHPEKDMSENNRCYVISLVDGSGPSGQLSEIMSLVRTQGDTIAGHEIVRQLKLNPRTLIGTGKLKEIAAQARDAGADLLVVDAELSPSQMRNLEDVTNLAVSDREAVILNVFSKNAKTRRAKIQVEIAHLEYLRPRIRGLGLDMDQQASGIASARGPGETASAMLARKLDGRLSELKKALSKIKKTAIVQRSGRSSCKQVTLVGYTNAGKTSLMNALTGVELSARNRPFETLDTTTRNLSCYGGDVLLSDTVGFIRRLPERLFASFESTLEGINDASLLVFVVDISDDEKETHLRTTFEVLSKLGAEKIPVLYVFNKTDLLTDTPSSEELLKLSRGNRFICLSSHNQDSIVILKDAILKAVHTDQQTTQLFVPYAASDIFPLIYAQCRVTNSEAKKEGLLLNIEGEHHILTLIKSRLSEVYNG